MSILVILGWIICGVFAYGLFLANFQKEYAEFAWADRKEDIIGSICVAFLGPVGLILVLALFGAKHGIIFKPISKQESWEAARKKFNLKKLSGVNKRSIVRSK